MSQPMSQLKRYEGLDVARGLAIALMFLSHTVKGLLSNSMIPDTGFIPIHVLTKFSSSLFVIVFGITMAVVYVPKINSDSWSQRRNGIWKRAILIMLWYKILVYVQMFQIAPNHRIMDTLMFKRFSDFAEILNFYAWFMLLVPFILMLWSRLGIVGKASLVYLFALSGFLLEQHFDFWGVWQIKAIVSEHQGTFCFGILPRGAMALFGLLLGEVLLRGEDRKQAMFMLAKICFLLGLALLSTYFSLYWENLQQVTLRIAKNVGKHPPAMPFMLWSIGGSLACLGFCLALPKILLKLCWPLKIIGKQSFFCFNFHIIVIFYFYRYVFDLRRNVSYEESLMLFGLLSVMSVAAAWGWGKWKTGSHKKTGQQPKKKDSNKQKPKEPPKKDQRSKRKEKEHGPSSIALDLTGLRPISDK
jgi:uncharacterized membrane protein